MARGEFEEIKPLLPASAAGIVSMRLRSLESCAFGGEGGVGAFLL